MTEITYSIKEVSEQSGWSIHMLRYYEKEGLLLPIARDENGYRCYTQGDVSLIQFLNRLRTTGMPVSQMRDYMQLLQKRQIQPQQVLPELLKLLNCHRETVLAHLDELRQNLDAIEYKINLYQTELEEVSTHGDAQTSRS
jgi:DNA-binding transcriptional MerR regulator